MSHAITLQTAIDMTLLYRENRENILASNYQNLDVLSLSETFNRDAIDTLLAQQGCEKIRIYFGMDENYKVHPILVGVNANNEDMIPDTNNNFEVMDTAIRCPIDCPPPSSLNS